MDEVQHIDVGMYKDASTFTTLESVSPTECLLISQICHSLGRYWISSDRMLMHRMLDNILLFFRICNGTTFTVFYMKYSYVAWSVQNTLFLAERTRDLILQYFRRERNVFKMRRWIFLLQVRVLLLFDSKGGLKRERFYW